jgi:hypothetical protein
LKENFNTGNSINLTFTGMERCQLLNILDYKMVPILTKVLNGNYLILLLHFGCKSNQRSKQTKLIQPNTTQVYFNLTGYPYMCATCFSMYLDHHQACQYRNHTKEETLRNNTECTIWIPPSSAGSWSSGSSCVFSSIITAEEGDKIGDMGSVRVQMLLETFMKHVP